VPGVDVLHEDDGVLVHRPTGQDLSEEGRADAKNELVRFEDLWGRFCESASAVI
jgi:hypothetical protein